VTLRSDLRLIAAEIPLGARVLDVGCGTGALLAELRDVKRIDGRGLELDPAKVSAAVARGLAVIQGDADRDLADFPSNGFDYAILSQTIQAMPRPGATLTELSRIAARVVVSFPNFAHWSVRAALLIGGRMPRTRALPADWHDTPNIHLCTITDFELLARALGLGVRSRRFLNGASPSLGLHPNLFARTAVYVLESLTDRVR